jgi:hypothetical protein
MEQPAAVPEPTRAVLGDTIRLTYERADGSRLEISLTRAAERNRVLTATTDAEGRLQSLSACSWPRSGPEPQFATRLRLVVDEVEE